MTGTELALPTSPTPTGQIQEWAGILVDAHKLGTALAQTAFVPREFRGKPEECAAAILYGSEVGLSPMQAVRSIFVIGGTPSMYARVMAAIVLAAGHEVWTVEKTDESVTVAGRRKGSPEDRVTTETWTYARAQKAGYTSNKKYQTDPQAMLYARALGDVCRQIAPDTLAGLAYTTEEMQLVDITDRVEVLPRAADVPTPPTPRAVEAPRSPRAELVELLAAEGHTSPLAVLGWLSEQLDRPIGNTRMVTDDEAVTLVALLRSGPADEVVADVDYDTGELPLDGAEAVGEGR